MYLELLKEKEKLAMAISTAKAGTNLDIDASISIYKVKQEVIERLGTMAKMNSSESLEDGKNYMINAEGNRTPYHYTIKSVCTIDYDLNAVKGIVRRLRREGSSLKMDLNIMKNGVKNIFRL